MTVSKLEAELHTAQQEINRLKDELALVMHPEFGSYHEVVCERDAARRAVAEAKQWAKAYKTAEDKAEEVVLTLIKERSAALQRVQEVEREASEAQTKAREYVERVGASWAKEADNQKGRADAALQRVKELESEQDVLRSAVSASCRQYESMKAMSVRVGNKNTELSARVEVLERALEKAHDALDDVNAGRDLNVDDGWCRWCHTASYDGKVGLVHNADCLILELRQVLSTQTATERDKEAMASRVWSFVPWCQICGRDVRAIYCDDCHKATTQAVLYAPRYPWHPNEPDYASQGQPCPKRWTDSITGCWTDKHPEYCDCKDIAQTDTKQPIEEEFSTSCSDGKCHRCHTCYSRDRRW